MCGILCWDRAYWVCMHWARKREQKLSGGCCDIYKMQMPRDLIAANWAWVRLCVRGPGSPVQQNWLTFLTFPYISYVYFWPPGNRVKTYPLLSLFNGVDENWHPRVTTGRDQSPIFQLYRVQLFPHYKPESFVDPSRWAVYVSFLYEQQIKILRTLYLSVRSIVQILSSMATPDAHCN